jgi:predicted metal-dependent hydrolase
MAKTTTVNHPQTGDVIFATSKRARRITISVRAFQPVRVSYPTRVSMKRAREYFEDNIGWVVKSRLKAHRREENIKELWSGLPSIDVKAEKRRMLERLHELAREHGCRFGKVSFRSQRTRWGSCSATNNISLNINLARLPRHLCDYVLLHELAHTKVKNHGSDFWDYLNILTSDNAKKLDKELSKYPIPQDHKQN